MGGDARSSTETTVHPSAVVHPEARLGRGVVVGPGVVIDAGAVLGDGTLIGPHCVIKSGVTIGQDNHLSVGVVLGEEPQHRRFAGERSFVRIGNGNTFREDVPPFVLAFGVPAHAYGLNSVGLTRAGMPPVHRTMLKRAFMLLYRSRLGVSTALARMEAELGTDPYVVEMIEFIRGSQERGIIRLTKERDDEGYRLAHPRRDRAHRGRGHPAA